MLPMFSIWVHVLDFAPFLAFTYCQGVLAGGVGGGGEEGEGRQKE